MEKIGDKIARWKNHRLFNIRCANSNVIPTCLKLRSTVKGEKADTILRRAERQLLNTRISHCCFTLRRLEEEKQKIEESLLTRVSPESAAMLSRHLQQAQEHAFEAAKRQQVEKFELLRKKQQDLRTLDTNRNRIAKERWVLNLSERVLTNAETTILQKGLNFAVPPKEIPVIEIITATEQACYLMKNKNNADRLRGDVVNILKRAKPPMPNISAEELQIIILPVDKGRVSVVMDATTYESKARALLSDNNTYVKLNSDPTQRFKSKLAALLKEWKEKKIISHALWKKLYPAAEDVPKFYGLPKIHKNKVPLRPIVSSIGSITYEEAKYLAVVIGPLVGKTEHHIKNSTDFVQKNNGLEVPLPRNLCRLMLERFLPAFPRMKQSRLSDSAWNKTTTGRTEPI